MKKIYRHLHIASSLRKLETKKFNGIDYEVVPVVALMEGVIWPVNAELPELVTASELAKAPAGWNGRPIVMNHPVIEDNRTSANDPTTLEESQFGIIFNTAMQDTKLGMEAWLDPDKAKQVDEAQDTLDRIAAGDTVEVSVGVWVVLEETSGEFNGIPYFGVWREIVPDHLAFLSDGEIGACSVEMGCGVPRTAVVHMRTARGFVPLNAKEIRMAKVQKSTQLIAAKSKWDAAHAKMMASLGQTDQGLRTRLNSALEEALPNFIGVEMVYPDDKMVVYATLNETDWSFGFWRAPYTTDAAGAVTVDVSSPEEVLQFITFETAASAAAKPRHSCSCGANKETDMTDPKNAKGEEKKKERVKSIIASKRTSFTNDDEVYLLSLSDARLTELEDTATKPETKEETEEEKSKREKESQQNANSSTTTTQQTAAATAGKKEVSVEEYVSQAPPAVREALQEGVRAASTRRATLIKILKDSGRCDFTDKELQAKPIDELDRLVKLVGTSTTESSEVDFSGQQPRSAAGARDEVPPPISLKEVLNKKAS